jgi:hypothetical protein
VRYVIGGILIKLWFVKLSCRKCLGDHDIYDTITLKEIFRNFYCEGVNWNELARESDLHNRNFLDEMNDQH